jgi:hypothetical protein
MMLHSLPAEPATERASGTPSSPSTTIPAKSLAGCWRSHAPLPGATSSASQEAIVRLLDLARLNELCLRSSFN